MSLLGRRRVLVVEDSLTIRKRIVEVLAAQFDVVGEAADGATAIELCERLRPNVLTMDMMMPNMNGVEATEHIMAYCPTPILIVSASLNRGELFRTYDALAAGAIDVLEKPLGEEPDGAWERRLIAAVETVARIPVITHPRKRLRRAANLAAAAATAAAATSTVRAVQPPAGRVIAIGASTGGPRAVLTVLQGLPPSLSAAVLLVVHISEPFGAAFAEWLDQQSPLRVRYAVAGERVDVLPPGTVLLAPPAVHLSVSQGRVELGTGPERHSCRPSVDVLFESVAREYGAQAAGCLLTGMGKDGALGLAAMKTAGAYTIAQDQATSVVFGMPGEAVRLGVAMSVLPLPEIAPALTRWNAQPVGVFGGAL